MNSLQFRDWADAEWPGLYDWMLDGCGVSAKQLVAWVCGIPSGYVGSEPCDESDYARCLNLVRRVPKIMEQDAALASLVVASPRWEPWIARLRADVGGVS